MASSVTRRPADPRALEGPSPERPAGWRGPHPPHTPRLPPCREPHTRRSLCTALPLTHPGWEHGDAGPFFKAEQMDLIRRANELQAQALYRRAGVQAQQALLTVRARAAETVQWGGCRGPSWGAWSGVQGCPARSCQC